MLLARVTIGDFDRFWATFTKAGADHRRAHGSAGARVFRDVDRPTEIVVLFEWSAEDYRRFMEDPETRRIMAEAGLAGPPETIELEPVGETGA
ncbi:hypothetical protein [Miltoncostaea marina]|uniref:hypothetical protein n=1 Tax=Miltoncostaea marina TaxID=2843215 RepID=UPI001C3DE0C1|nr:hypothetical protein [Miltoncostaea marina]